jgi:hypothetical protein
VLREGRKRDEWAAAFECAGGEFSVEEVGWSEL